MKAMIGERYRVPKRVCTFYDMQNQADHIKITSCYSGYLHYDICDASGRKIDNCEGCFELKHLSPYDGNSINQKLGGFMQKLTARLKRVLNKNLQAMYKLGWIDGDLKLTSDGKNALIEHLLDANEAEFGKVAQELVAETEKEEAKK